MTKHTRYNNMYYYVERWLSIRDITTCITERWLSIRDIITCITTLKDD